MGGSNSLVRPHSAAAGLGSSSRAAQPTSGPLSAAGMAAVGATTPPLMSACTPHAALAPLPMRLLLRSGYVVFTTAIAIVMPFFTDIIGLVGALVFWPAAVLYPTRLYIAVHRPRRAVRGAMLAMNVAAAVTSLLAVVGSCWNIQQHLGSFSIGGR